MHDPNRRKTVRKGGKTIMIKLFKKFLTNADGATMVEYGVIASLIIGAIVASMTPVAGTLSTAWTNLSGTMGG